MCVGVHGLPLCSRASRLHTVSRWMPWCQASVCLCVWHPQAVKCPSLPRLLHVLFGFFSQELNLCFLASALISITTTIIMTVQLWQGVTLLLQKDVGDDGGRAVAGSFPNKKGKKLFHARGGLLCCAVPGRTCSSSWACASSPRALLGGVHGSLCSALSMTTTHSQLDCTEGEMTKLQQQHLLFFFSRKRYSLCTLSCPAGLTTWQNTHTINNVDSFKNRQ